MAGPVGVAVRERGRTIAIAAEWWSIEVLHGAVSPFRWQAQHGSALIEAALTNGVRDGAWHAGVTAVAGSIAARPGRDDDRHGAGPHPLSAARELAATGRSVTAREYLNQSHAPEPPICTVAGQIPIRIWGSADLGILRAAR